MKIEKTIKEVRDELGIDNTFIANLMGFKNAASYCNSRKKHFYDNAIRTIYKLTKNKTRCK